MEKKSSMISILRKKTALWMSICLLLAGCGANASNNDTQSGSAAMAEAASETEADLSAENLSETEADLLSEDLSETDPSSENITESETQEDTDTEMQTEEPSEGTDYDVTFVFAGDVNLDDSWSVMSYAAQQPNGIFDCIDDDLVTIMREADICCINNEFAFSTQGTALEGKTYTFRSNPSNVSLLVDLGVDLVTLANNHVYDYGEAAFASTLATLSEAGIDYVGAGMDLEEAMEPVYYEWDGLTVAVVNATRAEKNIMTPQAADSSPGVLRCYDTAYFEQVIKEADANADYVICCVHWGTEYSYELEDVQKETARLYIDCGADIIIGTHTHCLQGIEYYNGKPIFYSLGNFWFNDKRLRTGLLELRLTGDSESEVNVKCTFHPAIQEECVTRYASSDEDRMEVLDLLNEISINAVIGDDGVVREED